MMNDLMVRGSTAYQKASGVYTRSGVFLLLAGLLFTGGGLLLLRVGEPSYFILIMGLLFVIYSVAQFFTAKRYRDK